MANGDWLKALKQFHKASMYLVNWLEQLKLRRQLLLSINTISKVNAANADIRMHLNAEGLRVTTAICFGCELVQVHSDLKTIRGSITHSIILRRIGITVALELNYGKR